MALAVYCPNINVVLMQNTMRVAVCFSMGGGGTGKLNICPPPTTGTTQREVQSRRETARKSKTVRVSFQNFL